MESQGHHRSVDRYPNYAALAANEIEGTDYRVTVSTRTHSPVAILAPHGGSIERRTSAIATALAADDFNLYLFEGLDDAGTFDTLHITSHRFDEPRALELVAAADHVIAVHGCSGAAAQVMLGGRDEALIERLAGALDPLAVDVRTDDHPYPGTHARNICNRGRLARGVQLELSDGLRGDRLEAEVIAAIREVLCVTQREPRRSAAALCM